MTWSVSICRKGRRPRLADYVLAMNGLQNVDRLTVDVLAFHASTLVFNGEIRVRAARGAR